MSSFEKHYAGLDITSSDNNGKMRPVSRVTLYVDDENVITAGDDTGLEISAECPNATQTIADMLLARFKGFQYQAMSANDANIDPAVELGDSVTADGMYSVIARISDDGSGYVSVSAPGEEELEDEYPMNGPLTRAITQATDRKIAETRSSITKTAEEIRAEVANDVKGLTSTITQTADTLRGEITSSEDKSKSLIEQKIGSISLSVTNGQIGSSASIELSVDGKKQTKSIDMTKVRNAFANDNSSITIGAGTVTFNSNTFVVNSTNFGVTSNGTITAKAGTIGGWSLSGTTISQSHTTGGHTYDVTIANYANDNAGSRVLHCAIDGTDTFYVHRDGALYATSADITGKITTSSGKIGNWTIGTALYSGTNSMSSTTVGTYLGTDGIRNYASGSKYVNITDGVLTAKGANIEGEFTADKGTIGGWEITSDRGLRHKSSDGSMEVVLWPNRNSLSNAVIYVQNTDGSSVPFRVNGDGSCSATKFTISGDSSFSGSLKSATGSINAGGTFTGTHSGGSLSNTGGSYEGSINSGGTFKGGLSNAWGSYNGNVYGGTGNGGGVLSSCSLGGTSLLTSSSNGGTVKTNSGGGLRLEGTVVYISGSGTGHIFGSTVNLNGNTFVNGNLSCTGTKPRTMTTAHYGRRQLDAFETPLPTFSDYGTASLDETGVLHIIIDPIFAETVDNAYLPTVFLTKYGEGDIWVERVTHDIVTVHGTPGLGFAWETRYAQANAGVERLRVMDFDYKDESGDHDFEGEANIFYEHNTRNIDYARLGYEYFTDFERSIEAT